jgi:hypothetical protein
MVNVMMKRYITVLRLNGWRRLNSLVSRSLTTKSTTTDVDAAAAAAAAAATGG